MTAWKPEVNSSVCVHGQTRQMSASNGREDNLHYASAAVFPLSIPLRKCQLRHTWLKHTVHSGRWRAGWVRFVPQTSSSACWFFRRSASLGAARQSLGCRKNRFQPTLFADLAGGASLSARVWSSPNNGVVSAPASWWGQSWLMCRSMYAPPMPINTSSDSSSNIRIGRLSGASIRPAVWPPSIVRSVGHWS